MAEVGEIRDRLSRFWGGARDELAELAAALRTLPRPDLRLLGQFIPRGNPNTTTGARCQMLRDLITDLLLEPVDETVERGGGDSSANEERLGHPPGEQPPSSPPPPPPAPKPKPKLKVVKKVAAKLKAVKSPTPKKVTKAKPKVAAPPRKTTTTRKRTSSAKRGRKK